jgi:hypothetical protein
MIGSLLFSGKSRALRKVFTPFLKPVFCRTSQRQTGLNHVDIRFSALVSFIKTTTSKTIENQYIINKNRDVDHDLINGSGNKICRLFIYHFRNTEGTFSGHYSLFLSPPLLLAVRGFYVSLFRISRKQGIYVFV